MSGFGKTMDDDAGSAADSRTSNGDRDRTWTIGEETIHGIGSFHKTLEHNNYGEVVATNFDVLKQAADGKAPFSMVPPGTERHAGDGTFKLTNPQGGLANDRLVHHPTSYRMPPAPKVDSVTPLPR